MKPCHQCPPSRCPQHMLCHPAGAQPHGAACAPCSRYPEGTPGPWGDPPVYPASPRSIVPSWLGCLLCLSPPCTHAHVHTRTRLVPQKVFSVARLCWCLCGCHSAEPPQPCCPTQSPVGRAVGRLQLSLGPCGGLGALGQKRCGVSIAMFLLRLSWRLVAVEGACPRCTNTG